MRRLSQEYPEYRHQIEVLAVSIDPSEPLSELRGVAQREGYPFPVAVANADMAARYQVVIRSTKILVDADGIMVKRWGYGVQPSEGWVGLFGSLAAR